MYDWVLDSQYPWVFENFTHTRRFPRAIPNFILLFISSHALKLSYVWLWLLGALRRLVNSATKFWPRKFSYFQFRFIVELNWSELCFQNCLRVHQVLFQTLFVAENTCTRAVPHISRLRVCGSTDWARRAGLGRTPQGISPYFKLWKSVFIR